MLKIFKKSKNPVPHDFSGWHTDKHGVKRHYVNGILSGGGNFGPERNASVIYPNGRLEYWKDGNQLDYYCPDQLNSIVRSHSEFPEDLIRNTKHNVVFNKYKRDYETHPINLLRENVALKNKIYELENGHTTTPDIDDVFVEIKYD